MGIMMLVVLSILGVLNFLSFGIPGMVLLLSASHDAENEKEAIRNKRLGLVAIVFAFLSLSVPVLAYLSQSAT